MTQFRFRLLAPAAILALVLAASGPARAQDGGCALPGTTSVKLPLYGVTLTDREPILVTGTVHAVVTVVPPDPIKPYAVLHADLLEGRALGLFTGERYLATGADSDVAVLTDPCTPTFRVQFRLFDPMCPQVPTDPCRVAIGTALNQFGMLYASQAEVVSLSDPGVGP